MTWIRDAPARDLPSFARAICDRHTGIGADGWMLVSKSHESAPEHGIIRLFNADGSEAEMSGNGTRCAAAFLIEAGIEGDDLRIQTGAGLKQLRLLEKNGRCLSFEMNMGQPRYATDHIWFPLPLSNGQQEVTILDVGNPQCVVFMDERSIDWRKIGAEIESHRHFPKRTNVSFVRGVDRHTIDVCFYERGAGETMSSGTGSTGAAVAAILRGIAESPVTVRTPAGSLELRWDNEVYLVGPAEIIATGEFYYMDGKTNGR